MTYAITYYKTLEIKFNIYKDGSFEYTVETDGDGFSFDSLPDAMAFVDTIIPTGFYGNY